LNGLADVKSQLLFDEFPASAEASGKDNGFILIRL
jgi:hypothetical protein